MNHYHTHEQPLQKNIIVIIRLPKLQKRQLRADEAAAAAELEHEKSLVTKEGELKLLRKHQKAHGVEVMHETLNRPWQRRDTLAAAKHLKASKQPSINDLASTARLSTTQHHPATADYATSSRTALMKYHRMQQAQRRLNEHGYLP